jgi:hypothetical protein
VWGKSRGLCCKVTGDEATCVLQFIFYPHFHPCSFLGPYYSASNIASIRTSENCKRTPRTSTMRRH